MTDTSLDLEAALMEGSLRSGKEYREDSNAFLATGYGIVRREEEDGTATWPVVDRNGNPLVVEASHPFVPPTVFVDLRSPPEECAAVEIMRLRVTALSPRLPGCPTCGSEHSQSGCTFKPAATCVYPRCKTVEPHSIFTCPDLH